ncbi:MAG: recombinase zinc beta ribbon domain-containing protein, partial [Elusimicrobia bacterium]|nr:recombinase zinc beta ribbon domain-containing protein [Elusimicrobiota bacterium]
MAYPLTYNLATAGSPVLLLSSELRNTYVKKRFLEVAGLSKADQNLDSCLRIADVQSLEGLEALVSQAVEGTAGFKPAVVILDSLQGLGLDSCERKRWMRVFEAVNLLIRCAVCGSRMTMNFSYSKGKQYWYYRCTKQIHQGKDACSVGSVAARPIKEAILRRISFLAEQPGLAEEIANEAKTLSTERLPLIQTQRKRLEQELKRVNGQTANLLDFLANTQGKAEEHRALAARLKTMEEAKMKLETELERAKGEETQIGVSIPDAEGIQATLRNFGELLSDLPYKDKRNLAHMVIDEVVYNEPKRTVGMTLNQLPNMGPAFLRQSFEICQTLRRGRDSNPRDPCEPTRFPGAPFQ